MSEGNNHIRGSSGSLQSALVGAAILAIINITAIAYGYGVLNQSVQDLSRRIGQLEQKVDYHILQR
jgi:hypothetical protein